MTLRKDPISPGTQAACLESGLQLNGEHSIVLGQLKEMRGRGSSAWDLDHSNAGDVEANEETYPTGHLKRSPWPGLAFSAPWPLGSSEQPKPEQVICNT